MITENRRLCLMLVEDDPDIREIVSMSLRLDPEVDVVAVEDGAGAIARLAEARFDAVIIDATLPDMSGVELAGTIRLRSDSSLIFLTAAVRPEDRARYLGAGAIGIIGKPFNPLTLPQDVRALLANARASI